MSKTPTKAKPKPLAKHAEPKTVAVTVRVPTSLHRKIKRIADADNRSVNNWMLTCIERAMGRDDT